jgi:hypothetical protein
MKKFIFAMVATAVAIAFSSCSKDPNGPRVGGNVSVGVNSYGGVWVNASLGVGFGGGYYYPTFYPNHRVPLQNSFVLYVFSKPDALDTKTKVFMKDGSVAIDPATGQQMVIASFSGNAIRAYLNNWDYTKGPAPVLIQRETMPTKQDLSGAYIYDYNIL